MSYILDALKKSDQERQQGNSPHLYSVHSSAPPVKKFSSFELHRGWLFAGGILIFFICLGILVFLYRQQPSQPLSAKRNTEQTTPLEQPTLQGTDKNDSAPPLVLIKEKNNVPKSIAVKETTSPPPGEVANETSPQAPPLLKDLSAKIQAEIPDLKFAGHTYSDNPSQRMIIVNGQILREGDTIGPYTHLSEITWEGVIIDFKGIRFLVKTN